MELPESLPGEESIIEVEQTDSDLQRDLEYDSFSKEQDDITVGLLFEQMERCRII